MTKGTVGCPVPLTVEGLLIIRRSGKEEGRDR